MARPARLVLTLVLACAGLGACTDYPRDAEGSLLRARSAALRVGVSHDPPYVVLEPGHAPAGPEIDLVRALASSQRARIEWVPGGHDALMDDLLAFRLQLVAGGHARHSAWQPRVAWSRPYLLAGATGGATQRRLALPPGESAWQLAVDGYVLHHQQALALQAAHAP